MDVVSDPFISNGLLNTPNFGFVVTGPHYRNMTFLSDWMYMLNWRVETEVMQTEYAMLSDIVSHEKPLLKGEGLVLLVLR